MVRSNRIRIGHITISYLPKGPVGKVHPVPGGHVGIGDPFGPLLADLLGSPTSDAEELRAKEVPEKATVATMARAAKRAKVCIRSPK